jgi:hypothetical protein
VFIQEESDIAAAKEAIKQDFDVVIANYGNPEDRFAYELLSEIGRMGLQTPLVIYGIDNNPKFAREALCYGAVARTTEIGTLFSAVIRAIAPDTRPKVSDRLRQLCIEQGIGPYDPSGWRPELDETRVKRTSQSLMAAKEKSRTGGDGTSRVPVEEP